MIQKRRLRVRRDKTDWDLLDPWLWCLHCERCYRITEFRKEDDLAMCAYEDCEGSQEADGWLWEIIREIHPEYPKRPKFGEVYRLYDFSSKA